MTYLVDPAADREPRFDPDPAAPLRWLSACPRASETPLWPFRAAPDAPPILIKDERLRMGLGSFKALGGVYAVARLVARRAGAALGREIAPEEMSSEAVRRVASGLTFICCSAGNHGLSVAAGARLFGAGARIHVARSVPEAFVARLEGKGAEVRRSGRTYEEGLAAAEDDVARAGADAILLADGAQPSGWPGYWEPPALVMEGYTVIAEELRARFEASGDWPTHVYLQAGVGGLAAAVARRIRAAWAEQPRVIVVEPEAAPCLKESVAAGVATRVAGPVSAMGRLDCKEPSMLALHALQADADAFALVSEAEAEAAARRAAEAGAPTTPSGAAGLAAALRDLPLDATATDAPAPRPLVILSEGLESD